MYLLRNQTPGRSVFYPPCPFYHFTRLYCPGCGTGRALHSLANLEILKAFSFNILTVLLTPFLLFSFFRFLYYYFRNTQKPEIHFSGKAVWIFFVIVILFWILRNISFWPFTLLAP
ncbi:MAG: hypothetical protein A2Y41_05470 [Spirochaetes bacterium GWB1_36_13]|nr:MAG: hypothetical protein A2Y41_05470 [Spirochaetes bacterium GWB1_36_13]